jgi:hypothetical protein
MKLAKTAIITIMSMSLIILATPAFGKVLGSKSAYVTTASRFQMSATMAEYYLTNHVVVTPTPVVAVPELVVFTPSSNITTDYVFSPVVDAIVNIPVPDVTPIVLSSPEPAVTQPTTSVPAPVTPTSVVVDPVPVAIPPATSAPAQQSAQAPINTPNGSDYAPNGIIWCSVLGHIPDLGQSCQLPDATTDYSMPTWVVYAPNTLSFTGVPSASNVVVDNSGKSVYTPTFAAGTPEAGPITLSASGSCSSDGTTVTFSGNSCSVTISQPGAAPVTQFIQVLPASTEPQS